MKLDRMNDKMKYVCIFEYVHTYTYKVCKYSIVLFDNIILFN